MNNEMQNVITALVNWYKQDKEREHIAKRKMEMATELDDLDRRERVLEEEKRKYTNIALRNHKYWTDESHTVLIRRGDIFDNEGLDVEYYVKRKGKDEERHFASSLDILRQACIPVTDKEYTMLYRNMQD